MTLSHLKDRLIENIYSSNDNKESIVEMTAEIPKTMKALQLVGVSFCLFHPALGLTKSSAVEEAL